MPLLAAGTYIAVMTLLLLFLRDRRTGGITLAGASGIVTFAFVFWVLTQYHASNGASVLFAASAGVFMAADLTIDAYLSWYRAIPRTLRAEDVDVQRNALRNVLFRFAVLPLIVVMLALTVEPGAALTCAIGVGVVLTIAEYTVGHA